MRELLELLEQDARRPVSELAPILKKSEYEVVLKEIGEQKMTVIKAIKDILGLGLKESKELVDAAPKTVKAGISNEEADEIEKKLKEAGATVEVK